MASIRLRYNGGTAGEQWDTDKLRARFGTKDGEVPFIEKIYVFSDTNARLIVFFVDPGMRAIRHQAVPIDVNFVPSFDHVEHGQYPVNFDTDKSTQMIEIMDECKATFAIQSSGGGIVDATIIYHNVRGTYVGRLELERLNDRKHMDRQDSLVDSRSPGFRMGNLRILGDNDPRSGQTT